MTVDKKEINGFDVVIAYDPDCESPRDGEHGCELALSHRRYDLADDSGYASAFDDLNELETALRAEFDVLYVAPVYGYDHGGIALRAGQRTGQFGDPWDSGLAGLAYVTRKNWEDTQGKGVRYSPKSSRDRARAAALIDGDVEEYSRWLNGECYGYTVTDPRDGEQVDSCWGFIGFEYAEQAAREAAGSCELEVKCSGRLNTRSGRIEHGAMPCPLHGEAVMS